MAIDAKRRSDGGDGWEVFTYGGRKATGLDVVDYAAMAVARGRGRNPANLDGSRRRAGRLRCRPAGGGERRGLGAGDRQRRRRNDSAHLVDAVKTGHADAVLAASIFHFGEISIGEAKAAMRAAGIPVRPVWETRG